MNRRSGTFGTNAALLTLLPLTALWGCSSAPESEARDGEVEMYTGPGASAPATNPNGTASNPSASPPGGTSTGETPAVPNLVTPPAGSQGGTTPTGTTPPTVPATDPNAPPVVTPPTTGPASAGCGLAAGRPANPNVANTIVTFPTNYDGSTPVPLLFAFHGAGRTNLDMQTVDSRTLGGALESTYAMAYMKSAGNAWDLNTDFPRFQAVLAQMLGEFCIDTEHLFAMGHSSGAQFIASMLANHRAEVSFAGVVPVSSNRVGTWSPIPTMLIHGMMDSERPNDPDGAIDISQYTESNQCTENTTPLNVPSCTSLALGATVNPGCVQYDGCAAPTIFCKHNDPNYIDAARNNLATNHGWPCFANSQILQFFESLR